MSRKRSEDAKLAWVMGIAREPATPAIVAELRDVLLRSTHHVVAKGADYAAEQGLAELAPHLVGAFERFLIDPVKTDKTCSGKIAIINALNALDYSDSEIFLKAARHIQMEPAWEGEIDTAIELRAASISGLVRSAYPGLISVLVDLLVDQAVVVRAAAAQGIACSGHLAAAPLLRLKALMGDAKPEVIGECLAGLLQIEPHESIPFVTEFLNREDEPLAEAALIAIGNSRRPEGFDILREYWNGCPPADLREPTLLAMALLRRPVATDFLISLLADRTGDTAQCAISALAVFSYDRPTRDRVAAAIGQQGDPKLRKMFDEKFGL